MEIASAINAAKTANKTRKIYDEGGLYLLLKPGRQPGWRLRYRLNGCEYLLSLGTYDEKAALTDEDDETVPVSLAGAREKRDALRKLIRRGINPSDVRKQKKQEKLAAIEAARIAKEAVKTAAELERERDACTFKVVAREWLECPGFSGDLL